LVRSLAFIPSLEIDSPILKVITPGYFKNLRAGQQYPALWAIGKTSKPFLQAIKEIPEAYS